MRRPTWRARLGEMSTYPTSCAPDPRVRSRRAKGAATRGIIFLVTFLASIDMLPNLAHAACAPPQPNGAQIRLGLRKLGVVGNVLYVAAHPDDENNNLLAYLSNEKLLRTAYLSLTRGDGGQNLIGAEQGTDLGVIRTQELLAARRIDGAEQLFTRARDFGYSKHAEETLRIWDRDAVLADVVHAIRTFRPDVIITRFSPEQTDTHGHHTASAQLALAAFHAAADASFHPEQLGQGTKPWQARRIYLEPLGLGHQAGGRHGGLEQAGGRPLQPLARPVLRGDGGPQPQHAQESGLRGGLVARAGGGVLPPAGRPDGYAFRGIGDCGALRSPRRPGS